MGGNFSGGGGIFQGVIWWVGIFRGGIFLEPRQTKIFHGEKMFIEIRLCNPMTYFLKGMSRSWKYTWWSLMYQFSIGLK